MGLWSLETMIGRSNVISACYQSRKIGGGSHVLAKLLMSRS